MAEEEEDKLKARTCPHPQQAEAGVVLTSMTAAEASAKEAEVAAEAVGSLAGGVEIGVGVLKGGDGNSPN